MQRRNIIGVATRRGYRTVELYEGDLTDLGAPVDILVISAYRDSYSPTPGTVHGALLNRLSIDSKELSRSPAFDFRDQLGVWISRPIEGCNFGRILCVELRGRTADVEDALRNVFVGLLILEAKGIEVRSAALPVLGAGSQRLPAEAVVPPLLAAVKDYFDRSSQIERLLLVEINPDRVRQLDAALNASLGRSRVTLPRSQILESLRSEMKQALLKADTLFSDGGNALRDDWLRVLDQPETASFELGVLSRKLVERLADRLPARSKSGGDLRARIDDLGGIGVAPWIRSYMHVLRLFGNESAHEGERESRRPRHLEEEDLALCLLCVQRLLEFWNTHQGGWRA